MSDAGIFSRYNGYRLSQAITYFGDVIKYLREKSFASEITYYCTDHWTIEFLVKDVSKEFVQQVIKPWVANWSERVRPQDVGVIRYKYDLGSWVVISIPLAASEIDGISKYIKVAEDVKRGLIAL